jgi:hypothetical protein
MITNKLNYLKLVDADILNMFYNVTMTDYNVTLQGRYKAFNITKLAAYFETTFATDSQGYIEAKFVHQPDEKSQFDVRIILTD